MADHFKVKPLPYAYYRDQGPARAKYIEAYLKNINWQEVNRRYSVYSKIAAEFRATR